jgi:hypothetical protein
MDQWRASFDDAFARALGQGAGDLVVWVTLLVFAATFLVVVYLLLRASGVDIQVSFRNAAPGEQPPRREPQGARREQPLPSLATHGAAESRRSFLRGLDTAQQAVGKFLVGTLVVALVAATALVALVWLTYPDDGNRDFVLFYSGAVYLVGALGLIAKIAGLRRQLEPPTPGERSYFDELRSKVRVFEVETEPQMHHLGADALERARRHVAAGGSLEDACAAADPRYSQLPPWAQKAFRKAIEMALREA